MIFMVSAANAMAALFAGRAAYRAMCRQAGHTEASGPLPGMMLAYRAAFHDEKRTPETRRLLLALGVACASVVTMLVIGLMTGGR